MRVRQAGVEDEHYDQDQLAGERGHPEPAPLHSIRDRTSDQRKEQERDEITKAQQPDRERRAGDRVDLIRDRHKRYLGAELRDGSADQEQAEIA